MKSPIKAGMLHAHPLFLLMGQVRNTPADTKRAEVALPGSLLACPLKSLGKTLSMATLKVTHDHCSLFPYISVCLFVIRVQGVREGRERAAWHRKASMRESNRTKIHLTHTHNGSSLAAWFGYASKTSLPVERRRDLVFLLYVEGLCLSGFRGRALLGQR